MLMILVDKFDQQLPVELTIEETLEVGIIAWNIANNKEFLLCKNLYEQEIKSCKYSEIVKKWLISNQKIFQNIII